MKQFMLASLFILTLIMIAIPNARAEEAKAAWSCMKDAKTIGVEGKTAEEKKHACELKGGKWTEAKVKSEEKQSSGKSDGW